MSSFKAGFETCPQCRLPAEPLREQMAQSVTGIISLLPWLQHYLEKMEKIDQLATSRAEQMVLMIEQIALSLEQTTSHLAALNKSEQSTEALLRDLKDQLIRLGERRE